MRESMYSLVPGKRRRSVCTSSLSILGEVPPVSLGPKTRIKVLVHPSFKTSSALRASSTCATTVFASVDPFEAVIRSTVKGTGFSDLTALEGSSRGVTGRLREASGSCVGVK